LDFWESHYVRIERDIDIFSSTTIRESLSREIRESDGAFTIDVRRVRYIDSVGLGLLVYARHMLAQEGRELHVVVEPESSVERIIDITGLRSLLNATADGMRPGIESA
jgi:anti-anti-sigma factor